MKIQTQRIIKDGEKYDLTLYHGRHTFLTHAKTGKSYTLKAKSATAKVKRKATADGYIAHYHKIFIVYKASDSECPIKKIVMRYSFRYKTAFNKEKCDFKDECNAYKKDEKRPTFISNIDSLLHGSPSYDYIFSIARQRKEKILDCSVMKAKVLNF